MPKRVVIMQSSPLNQGNPLGAMMGRQTAEKPAYVAADEKSAAAWLDRKEAEVRERFSKVLAEKIEEDAKEGKENSEEDYDVPVTRINSLNLGAAGVSYIAIWTDSDV